MHLPVGNVDRVTRLALLETYFRLARAEFTSANEQVNIEFSRLAKQSRGILLACLERERERESCIEYDLFELDARQQVATAGKCLIIGFIKTTTVGGRNLQASWPKGSVAGVFKCQAAAE